MNLPFNFKYVLKYLSIFIILFTTLSCRKLVQDDFDDITPKTCLSGIVSNNGDTLGLIVFKSRKLDSSPITNIDDAEVELWIDGIYTEKLFYSDSGYYQSTTVGEVGKTYQCIVKTKEGVQLKGQTYIPETIYPTHIKIKRKAGVDNEGAEYSSISFTFKNNPAKKLFFEITLHTGRIYHPGNIALNERSNASLRLFSQTDKVLLNEGLPIPVFSNEIIRDTTYTMTLNFYGRSFGDYEHDPLTGALYPIYTPVILGFRSVSHDYYLYKRQIYLYEQGRFPEGLGSSPNVFPVYSNIENGGGVFIGYSLTQTDTLTIPKRL